MQGVVFIVDSEALLTAGIWMLNVLICTGEALYVWLWSEENVERCVSRLRSRHPELDANALESERAKKRKQLRWIPLVLLVGALAAGVNVFFNLLIALGI